MNANSSCKRSDDLGVQKKKTNPNYYDKSIAIAGYSVRAINESAKCCGLKTLAIDCFADMDLRRSADKFAFINLDQFKDEKGKLDKPSVSFISDWIESNQKSIRNNDYFVIGSGFENYPEIFKKLDKFSNFVGSSSESVEKVRSVKKFYPFLLENDISFPTTISFSIYKKKDLIEFIIYDLKLGKNSNHSKPEQFSGSVEDFFIKIVIKNLQLPFVLKSEKSGGGFGIYSIKDFENFKLNVENILEMKGNKLIAQQLVLGNPMSCSFISNGIESKIIFISEQIIGEHKFGAQNDFTYCGNIISKKISSTTFESNIILTEKLEEIVRKIVEFSGIKGSNGMDFILQTSEDDLESIDVSVIEINSRFQGTMDLFESATGYNVMEMHLESILNKKLPMSVEFPSSETYLKTIFYSPLDFHILVDLQGFNFKDVPLIGNRIYEGQPLCSSIVKGSQKIEAFNIAIEDRNLITRVLSIKNRIDPDSEFLNDG